MKKLIYTALILTSLITTTTIFAQEEFTKPQETSSFTKPPALQEEITVKDETFRSNFPYIQLGVTGVGVGYRSQTGSLGCDVYAKGIPKYFFEAGANGLVFLGKSPVYFGAGGGIFMGGFDMLPRLNLLAGLKMSKKSFIQINAVDTVILSGIATIFSSKVNPAAIPAAVLITTSVEIGF